MNNDNRFIDNSLALRKIRRVKKAVTNLKVRRLTIMQEIVVEELGMIIEVLDKHTNGVITEDIQTLDTLAYRLKELTVIPFIFSELIKVQYQEIEQKNRCN